MQLTPRESQFFSCHLFSRPTAGGNILSSVALTSSLSVDHIRLASVYPPVTLIVVFKHVFGVKLGCGVIAKDNRWQVMVRSVLIYEVQCVLS